MSEVRALMTEDQLDILWHQQNGIDPVTGEMWLTPYMMECEENLKRIWKNIKNKDEGDEVV